RNGRPTRDDGTARRPCRRIPRPARLDSTPGRRQNADRYSPTGNCAIRSEVRSMSIRAFISVCGVALAAAGVVLATAQQGAKPRPEDTEVWEPEPPVVTPGSTDAEPPSDAIVLFDGTNLDEWVNTNDKAPAGWTVADGVLTVEKKAGNIETKRTFRNYQLHLEWRIPTHITGEGQGRGNSGVFLASTGPGDAGYEIQV